MTEGDPNSSRGLSKWRGVLQLVIIAAIILAAIFLARAPQQEFLKLDSETSRLGVKPTVAVFQPTVTRASHEVDLTGTVTTLGNVLVIPEATGDIVFVSENFRAGGVFKADETLARIDSEAYEIGLASAKEDLVFAQAHLKEVKDRFGRSTEYYATQPDGTVHPWPALDGAIEKAESLVTTARYRVELAGIQLDQTRIRMPFDGFVHGTSLSIGQVVVARTSTLGDVFPKYQLRVRAQITSSDLDSLQPIIGRSASVVADGRTYQTSVERVSKVVDLETRLASLYLSIYEQETLDLLPPPGTFVDVTVVGPTREGVFVLPEASIQLNASVWLVDNGKLVSFVPTSRGFGDNAWIVDAFDAKDGVILGSVVGARAGLDVHPVQAESR